MLRELRPARDSADLFEGPKIVFLHPAVAGHDEYEPAIGRKFRPAVDGIGRCKAVKTLKRVAIQNGDVVIAGFHDDKEIEGVRFEYRLRRRRIVGRGDATAGNIGCCPCRHLIERRIEKRGKGRNLVPREPVLESRHLRCRSALPDDLRKHGPADPRERLGNERRSGSAQSS